MYILLYKIKYKTFISFLLNESNNKSVCDLDSGLFFEKKKEKLL